MRIQVSIFLRFCLEEWAYPNVSAVSGISKFFRMLDFFARADFLSFDGLASETRPNLGCQKNHSGP